MKLPSRRFSSSLLITGLLCLAGLPAFSVEPTDSPEGFSQRFETRDDRAEDGTRESPRAGASNGEPRKGGVEASYKGGRINLMTEGWQGARICAEFSREDVRCYDTDEEFRRDSERSSGGQQETTSGEMTTMAQWDCPVGWACVWQHIDYVGDRLQWQDQGMWQDLAQWGFRDKASSVCNNRGGIFEMRDFRTGMPDPVLTAGPHVCHRQLSQVGYPTGIYGGGHWNDRIDSIRLN